MAKLFNSMIDDLLKEIPKSVGLKLPTLKKESGESSQPPKLKLPKLKRATT